jgi:hypothetical protein
LLSLPWMGKLTLFVVTSMNKAALRKVPLSRIRKYMAAYNIAVPSGTVDKDDLVDVILAKRVRSCFQCWLASRTHGY